MWLANRTTIFKDGSNVSDYAFRTKSLFQEEKHFNNYKYWPDHCFTNSQRYNVRQILSGGQQWQPSLWQIQLLEKCVSCEVFSH